MLIRYSHQTEHFGVETETKVRPIFYVRDLDHGATIVATCRMESTAILIADLLDGHRRACRQVATVHRPTCGAES